MQLHIKYLRITNQILHSFLSTVQMLQSYVSDDWGLLCVHNISAHQ